MMLVNTVGAYSFYIAAIILPQAIWLGLTVSFFGLFPLLGHGVTMNIKGRTLYNPGLATTVFLLVPIGVYYIHYLNTHGLATRMDFVFGIIAFLTAIVIVLVLPIRAFMDRNTPYPMRRQDMARFGMLAKIKAKGLVDV